MPDTLPVPATTLIVDDEPGIRILLHDWLCEHQGMTVHVAACVEEAYEILEKRSVDLLLVDLFLGDGSGLDVIRRAREIQPHAVSILITAHPTIETAISALQTGTYDYLIKPFRLEMLSAAVFRALENCQLRRENMELREQVAVSELNRAVGAIAGIDQILQTVIETVIRECSAEAASVVLRHSETGKLEMRAFHGDKTLLDDPQQGRFLRGESITASTVLSLAKTVVLEDSQMALFPADHDGAMRICQPLMVKGQTMGLLNIVRRANAGPVGDGALRTIGMIAQQAAFAIDNARLYKDLQATYIETVTALANAIEIRDPYTHGHTDRVKVIARAIGAKMGWDAEKLATLWMGCTLHDIGKIGVPDSILSKPGPLTADEFAIMKTHPVIGAKIIEGVPFLKAAMPYVYYHHERYNGTGYPTGAAGEEIPIEGRLLAIVDAFDAITSDRPYRRSQSIAAACEELRIFSGIQFDPLILDVFFQVLDSTDFPWIVAQRPREMDVPIPVSL